MENLQRVALFYEIARSRHHLADAVRTAVQVGRHPRITVYTPNLEGMTDYRGSDACATSSAAPRSGASSARTDVRGSGAVGILRGHEGAIGSIAFSPDGRTLAAADGGTIRLWDARSRTQIGPALTGHSGPVNAVAFSPDGRTLASASDDTTIRLWDGILWRGFRELEDQACALVGRGLTRAEWAQFASGIPYRHGCS